MMMVSLMNLGDAPRVFNNRLGKKFIVPVGRVVTADMTGRAVQDIKFSRTPETVLVREGGDTKIPDEMQKVVDLMAVIEFGDNHEISRRFKEMVPPQNMNEMRPSRAQIRRYLRTMVEDFIIAESGRQKQVRDDVDEEQLVREFEMNEPDPVHPLVQKRRDDRESKIVQAAFAPITEAAAETPASPARKKAAAVKGRRRR